MGFGGQGLGLLLGHSVYRTLSLGVTDSRRQA